MMVPRILLKKYISPSGCVNLKALKSLVLPNARSRRSVLSNGKRPTRSYKTIGAQQGVRALTVNCWILPLLLLATLNL